MSAYRAPTVMGRFPGQHVGIYLLLSPVCIAFQPSFLGGHLGSFQLFEIIFRVSKQFCTHIWVFFCRVDS